MPALLTHYIQADCTLKLLKNRDNCADFCADIDEKAFYWGAQGPDFLYFHRAIPLFMPGKPKREIGTVLHSQKSDDLMSAFAEYCILHPDDKSAYSYACGFLCHYALDCIAHPYVYAQQKSIIEAENVKYFEGYVHSRIEHNLDVIILSQYKNEHANCFNFDEALSNDAEMLDKIGGVVQYVSNKFINPPEKPITKKQMIRAFKDTHNLQKISRDKHGIKHALVRTLEKICFYPKSISTLVRTSNEDGLWDYANIKHSAWQNPYDEKNNTRYDSFDDLLKQSALFSAELIDKFSEYLKNGISLIDFTENLSFKTGLEML